MKFGYLPNFHGRKFWMHMFSTHINVTSFFRDLKISYFAFVNPPPNYLKIYLAAINVSKNMLQNFDQFINQISNVKNQPNHNRNGKQRNAKYQDPCALLSFFIQTIQLESKKTLSVGVLCFSASLPFISLLFLFHSV
jgi:hypothetical protein